MGVIVDRDNPDETDGFTWRVTFLDEAQSGPLNFDLSVTPGSNNIRTTSGAVANLTVTKLRDGEVFPPCVGLHQIPSDKPLVKGQLYYTRVFAINSKGFSAAAVASAPQKPMVVPGPPTSVVLQVSGPSSLYVTFNPPVDDGGDTITLYKVEYALTSTFANALSVNVTYLDQAPYYKTITGLTQGVFVFVRVSALNRQGFGPPALSTPSSLNPYTTSSGPTSVKVFATSDTMLTVSWGPPVNNGGDEIISYRIDWDITSSFNSGTTGFNKGSVDLDASLYSSYTIQYLSSSTVYYVRVAARNSAVPLGTYTLAFPSSISPALVIPGRPHTIRAYSGNGVGRITVSWLRPTVPWHAVPCFGKLTNVQDCPVVGGLPQSDGGSPIYQYTLSYNEQENFLGYDSGSVTTTGTSYTLTNLIPGRRYYIRVLANNNKGPGFYCAYSDPNCLSTATNIVSAIATTILPQN